MNKFTPEQRLKHTQECYDELYNLAISKKTNYTVKDFLEECRTAPEGVDVFKYYGELFIEDVITKENYKNILESRKSFLEKELLVVSMIEEQGQRLKEIQQQEGTHIRSRW